MFITDNERSHLARALYLAIQEQEKYEREVLKYTGDSGQVAAWRDILIKLKNGR